MVIVRYFSWVYTTRRNIGGRKLNMSVGMITYTLTVHVQNLRWLVYYVDMHYRIVEEESQCTLQPLYFGSMDT